MTGSNKENIQFAIDDSWLGYVLAAQSPKGLCAVLLGNEPNELKSELRSRFPEAELIEGSDAAAALLAQVIGCIEDPSKSLDMPFDERGTSFQKRVWKALKEIPCGSTVSYTEIAQKIGSPQAVRAVGTACGANALAIVVPCHRVVRNDGSINGYRWGIERKKRLLERESLFYSSARKMGIG